MLVRDDPADGAHELEPLEVVLESDLRVCLDEG